MEATERRVLMGTCGWSDQSLLTCGRFYPKWVKNAEDRLEVYSRHFPCVEVDTSCYAIPRPETTAKWAARTPPLFRFHFKAFGAFCHQGASLGSLPLEVREMFGPDVALTQHVPLSRFPPGAEQRLWDQFHACLAPVQRAGRLGAVLFQFQTSFRPGAASREHVLVCRRQLRADIRMAVEFRCREWFKDPAAAADLSSWLTSAGICLVAADELRHETAQKDRQQVGLPPGEVRQVLPIALHITQPDFGYVRLHRRHGTTDRLVPQDEIAAWARRLAHLTAAPAPREGQAAQQQQQQQAAGLSGPVYFLWGTDYEDAPLINARALEKALPQELVYDYAAALRQHDKRRGSGSLTGLWAAAAATAASRHKAAPAAAGVAGLEQGAASGATEQAAAAAAAVDAAPDTAAAAADGVSALDACRSAKRQRVLAPCGHQPEADAPADCGSLDHGDVAAGASTSGAVLGHLAETAPAPPGTGSELVATSSCGRLATGSLHGKPTLPAASSSKPLPSTTSRRDSAAKGQPPKGKTGPSSGTTGPSPAAGGAVRPLTLYFKTKGS